MVGIPIALAKWGTLLSSQTANVVTAAAEDVLRERDFIEAVRRTAYVAPFSDIRRALEYLADTYVFKNAGDNYRFYMPRVKQKVRETESDISYVISSLAAEYRECVGR